MTGKGKMPPEKICKTVRQYSREPVSPEDMQKLREIAEDYRKVKNYVYTRFGGIGSLGKLYPGYTVQNEMTASGYRETLGLPSVYFYLAVFDALGDIKGQWARTKGRLTGRINKNGGFTEEEKHYLRFLIKVNNAFEAVLNRRPVRLAKGLQKQYEELAGQVDVQRLHRYLSRQVRRDHVKLHTDAAEGFSAAERAYRYGDHGIYLSIKEKRKRVYIPLTDQNRYQRQLYVRLYPAERRVELVVPVKVAVRCHGDYCNQVGLALGIYVMLTTDEGRTYGEDLGKYQIAYAEWTRAQTKSYNRNRKDNPGRMKYNAKKRRMTEQLHGYINQELNRFLRTEKPKTIYMIRFSRPRRGGMDREINHSVTQWQRGYIRKRLMQKCREQSVEFVEVLGKGISTECSCCGETGIKRDGQFVCPACGYQTEEKSNTARNVKKRGQGDGAIRTIGSF
jgi:transposase